MYFKPFLKTLTCTVTFFFLNHLNAQQVKLISVDSLIKTINDKNDTSTIVINFWATWCKPCVHELPYFNKADSTLSSLHIKFIFVAFDGPAERKKVSRFIHSRAFIGQQFLLNTADLNDFIEGVDKEWQGDLPYTIVIKNGVRKNHKTSFSNIDELILFISR